MENPACPLPRWDGVLGSVGILLASIVLADRR